MGRFSFFQPWQQFTKSNIFLLYLVDTSMRFNSFSVGPGPDYRLFVQTDNVHFTEHGGYTFENLY